MELMPSYSSDAGIHLDSEPSYLVLMRFWQADIYPSDSEKFLCMLSMGGANKLTYSMDIIFISNIF